MIKIKRLVVGLLFITLTQTNAWGITRPQPLGKALFNIQQDIKKIQAGKPEFNALLKTHAFLSLKTESHNIDPTTAKAVIEVFNYLKDKATEAKKDNTLSNEARTNLIIIFEKAAKCKNTNFINQIKPQEFADFLRGKLPPAPTQPPAATPASTEEAIPPAPPAPTIPPTIPPTRPSTAAPKPAPKPAAPTIPPAPTTQPPAATPAATPAAPAVPTSPAPTIPPAPTPASTEEAIPPAPPAPSKPAAVPTTKPAHTEGVIPPPPPAPAAVPTTQPTRPSTAAPTQTSGIRLKPAFTSESEWEKIRKNQIQNKEKLNKMTYQELNNLLNILLKVPINNIVAKKTLIDDLKMLRSNLQQRSATQNDFSKLTETQLTKIKENINKKISILQKSTLSKEAKTIQENLIKQMQNIIKTVDPKQELQTQIDGIKLNDIKQYEKLAQDILNAQQIEIQEKENLLNTLNKKALNSVLKTTNNDDAKNKIKHFFTNIQNATTTIGTEPLTLELKAALLPQIAKDWLQTIYSKKQDFLEKKQYEEEWK